MDDRTGGAHPGTGAREQRSGGPRVGDPRIVGSIAAGRLREVAAFLERSVDAIPREPEAPTQLVVSLADTAMHVRLTADAVEHLSRAHLDEQDAAPLLTLVRDGS